MHMILLQIFIIMIRLPNDPSAFRYSQFIGYKIFQLRKWRRAQTPGTINA